jgi:hypothetical protein
MRSFVQKSGWRLSFREAVEHDVFLGEHGDEAYEIVTRYSSTRQALQVVRARRARNPDKILASLSCFNRLSLSSLRSPSVRRARTQPTVVCRLDSQKPSQTSPVSHSPQHNTAQEDSQASALEMITEMYREDTQEMQVLFTNSQREMDQALSKH